MISSKTGEGETQVIIREPYVEAPHRGSMNCEVPHFMRQYIYKKYEVPHITRHLIFYCLTSHKV